MKLLTTPRCGFALTFGLLASLTVLPTGLRAQPAALTESARAGRSLEEFIRRYSADANDTSRFYDLAWSEARFDRMEIGRAHV